MNHTKTAPRNLAEHNSISSGDIKPPIKAKELTIKDTVKALSRKPLHSSLLKTKRIGGDEILYIPWYKCVAILDKYCPGWEWEIVEVALSSDNIFLVGRLTLHCSDGSFSRSATGTERLKEKDGSEIKYGDSSSNSESMALRRCAAKFGLGRYLYD